MNHCILISESGKIVSSKLWIINGRERVKIESHANLIWLYPLQHVRLVARYRKRRIKADSRITVHIYNVL